MAPPMLIMAALEQVGKGIIAATNNLKERLDAALIFAEKAQQASLALGKTYGDTSKTLGGQIDTLRGSLGQRFEAGFRTLEAGLQSNALGVSRLINQQQLTNTTFSNTARIMARLEIGLDMSRAQTNLLAERIIYIGNKWEIGTDKLLNALNALSETFPVQEMAGLGPQFQEAIMLLQGELGPELAGDLTQMMKMLLDPSLENLPRLAILGMDNITSQINTMKNSQQIADFIKQAAIDAEKTIQTLGAGTDRFFQAGSVPIGILGRDALSLVNIVNGLGRRIEDGSKIIAEYYQTIDNFKREIWTPIEFALTALYEPLKGFWEALSVSVQVIGEGLKNWFGTFLKDTGPLIKDLKLAILNVSKTLVDVFGPMIASLGDNIGTKIQDLMLALINGILDLVKPGGALKSFERTVYTIIAGLMDAIDLIGFGNIFDDKSEIDPLKGKAVLAGIEQQLFNNPQFSSEFSRIMAAETAGLFKRVNTGGASFADQSLYGSLTGLDAFDTFSNAKQLGILTDVATILKSSPDQKKQLEQIEQMKQSMIDGKAFPNLKQISDNFNTLIKQVSEGKAMDLEFLKLQERIAENTDPDKQRSPTFLEDTASLLATSMERILGIRPEMSAAEIVDAINNLNNTVAMNKLLSSTTPAALGRGP